MISGSKPHLWLKRIIAYFFTLLVMSSIFYFSAQPATKSSKTSSGITKKIVNAVTKNKKIPPKKKKALEQKWEKTIRKIAHFSLFAILGICALISANLTFIKRGNHFIQKNALISLAFCILYAISDEVHQSFVKGRSCEFTDVLIDTSGSIFGILVIIFIIYLIKRKTEKLS